MKLFWKLLKHELTLPFKISALFILLFVGIIFLTILFGGVYLHTYVNDIPVVVLDEDNSSKSRLIISNFEDNERFNIKYYVQTRDEMENIINDGEAQLGIYIPKNFGKDISEMSASQVILYTDGTNVIIGNNAYAYAATIVQTIGAGVEMKMLTAKGALPQTAQNMALSFNFNDRILYDPKMTYLNYLLLGFIAVFLQQIMLSALSTSILQEKELLIEDHTTKRILAKIISCGFYALISMWTAIWLAVSVFHIILRGNICIALILSILFIFAISAPTIFLLSILKSKTRFSQIAYMLSFPTFLMSGCVWPADQMPPLMLFLNRLLWPLINFAKPFHEVLIKGVPLSTISSNILQLVAFTAFWLPLSIFYFIKKECTIKK